MVSMAMNAPVHIDTCVSNFYCDLDLNSEVMFDGVAEGMDLYSHSASAFSIPLTDGFM